MKSNAWSRCRLAVSFLPLLMAGTGSAQVLQSATFNVTTQFTNPAGAVRSRLESLAGPGVLMADATASTTEATPRSATSATVNATNRMASTVSLTVDAAGNPSWKARSRLVLDHYGEAYTSGESTAVAFSPGATHGVVFQSIASIVDITFSQSVSGGVLLARHPVSGQTFAQLAAIPAGNRVEVVVPGGVPMEIIMALETGSGGPTGSTRRVVRRLTDWTGVNMPDNVILPRSVNLTETATLGMYSGTFDVVGETELPSSTMPFYSGYSKVTATYYSTAFPTYGTWERRTVIPGNPSSGAFDLTFLTSTASIAANDPGAGSGYGLQAETFIKHKLPSANYAAQYLRTRLLTNAELPAVPANGGISLGNRLVLNPGYIQGKIQLNGPTAVPGVTPLLSMIKTAADDDPDGDGVPNLPVPASPIDWLFKSGIGSNTHINSQSSYGGLAWMVMERSFSANDVECEYELAVAGPNSETVEWTHPYIALAMNTIDVSEAQYFHTTYSLRHNGAASFPVAPGSTVTRNDSVDMGEVLLTLRPAAGSGVLIWQPQLQWGSNGLTGVPANTWTVDGIGAFGWPTTAAQAGNRATLRTILPAGTYTVRPTLQTIAGGNQGSTTIAPFVITVPPRGRVSVDNGVMILPNYRECITAGGDTFTGSINSNGSHVTSITWQLDGGPATAASFIPGVNANYAFTTPAGLGGTHTVTVTATTADGRTASYTQTVRVDNVPPVIICPANMNIYAAINAPQAVHYYPPQVTEDCESVSIICNPPSGSQFPIGTTVVTCQATDRAGNSSSCNFTITLHAPCPPPIRSHQFSAAAGTCFRYTHVPSWHSNVAMTIQAWVKRVDANACETIVAQNFFNSFWFGFCDGKLRFYRSGSSADAAEGVAAGQWTNVAVTYDGTTAKFYINGTAAGESPLASSGTGGTDPINIGGDYSTGSLAYGFTGMIDEVRISRRALGSNEIFNGLSQQWRMGLELAATFGSGGAKEDITGTLPFFTTAPAPTPQIEGMLPKWLNIPQVNGVLGVDGIVDTATEYASADKMVIRYNDGANGVQDAIAHFNYHDQPGDRALYIGIKGIRNVIAPWTRDQSWVAVELDPGAQGWLDAGPQQFRFNSRRLDGSFNPGPTPVGFERGTGSGNYTALLPGDPLISAPSPFGLIGPGGDTVEFRFDLSILGGNWRNQLRLGISHHWISGVGQDFGAPVGSSYDSPLSWSQAVFAGQIPELTLSRSGGMLYVSWRDTCNEWILETSSQLTPTSWTPMPFIRSESYHDGLEMFSEFNTVGKPRAFFRLRR